VTNNPFWLCSAAMIRLHRQPGAYQIQDPRRHVEALSPALGSGVGALKVLGIPRSQSVSPMRRITMFLAAVLLSASLGA
jgi:hypothetical protein